jgi:hypothetical protein
MERLIRGCFLLLEKVKGFNTEGTEKNKREKNGEFVGKFVSFLCVLAFEFLCGPPVSSVSSVLSF